MPESELGRSTVSDGAAPADCRWRKGEVIFVSERSLLVPEQLPNRLAVAERYVVGY